MFGGCDLGIIKPSASHLPRGTQHKTDDTHVLQAIHPHARARLLHLNALDGVIVWSQVDVFQKHRLSEKKQVEDGGVGGGQIRIAKASKASNGRIDAA